MAETESKSKRRAPVKIDEDAEPTGLRKLLQNPWVLLGLIIVIVTSLVLGIFMLSEFLSTGSVNLFD